LLQCVAARHERLDCGFDGRGHGADAHGPQELGPGRRAPLVAGSRELCPFGRAISPSEFR
jgi:hypothetical protein